MVSIFYSKSKNQFIKSTKSQKGKVSTEVVPYDKLKENKDIVIIKNSFNFDDNLEAYKDVFEIDIENESALQASTCFWDMIEYCEDSENKFIKLSAGTKLTNAQKEKSIITVNELMKVKHSDDECKMIPLIEKIGRLNPKDITDAFTGYTKKEVMNYIKFLETFFKDKFSNEFWDEIDKYVEEIRKEIMEALFPDDESKNKEAEEATYTKTEEEVNDDPCNSQFTGITEEMLKEISDSEKEAENKYCDIQKANLTNTSKDRLENDKNVPSLNEILASRDNEDNYATNMDIIKNQEDAIWGDKDIANMPIAKRLKNLTRNTNYIVDAALKEIGVVTQKVLNQKGVLTEGEKMMLMDDRLRLDCNRLFYNLIANKNAFYLFKEYACKEFGFKDVVSGYYPNCKKYIDLIF